MSTPIAAGPIVVGFVATPEGHAALRHAGNEALLRKLPLLVVDLSKDNHDATPAAMGADLADLRAELAAAGLAVDIAPPDALFEPSEHLVKVTQEADATLIVIGLRHRSRVGNNEDGATGYQTGSSVRGAHVAESGSQVVKGALRAPPARTPPYRSAHGGAGRHRRWLTCLMTEVVVIAAISIGIALIV